MANTLRIINARSPEQWAEIIRAKWQDTVAGIFETGQLLCNAREELGAAAFWVMTRDRLKFAKSTVSYLMTIATDERLSEVLHIKLPASYGTLYELTRLTDEQFQTGIDTGVIHAGMERKDVAQLRPPKKETQPIAGPALSGRELVEHRMLETRKQIVAALRELTPVEQLEFIALVRLQLDDLESSRKAGA
jgi:hypothetical protein